MATSVLIVPGYNNSGPEHWQSLWERAHPEYRRVMQRDWDSPERHEWVSALDEAIAQAPQPVVLVAHSLGCLAVVHWAARAREPQARMAEPGSGPRGAAESAGARRPQGPLPEGEAKRSGPQAGPWSAIYRATRLRHARNVGIFLQARLVLAWPHAEAEGTRFAMGFAAWRGVPVIDLEVAPWREALAALVAQAASSVPLESL